MKNLIMMLGLVVLHSQNLMAITNVKALEVNCAVKAKVNEVFDIEFNKGTPPRGRSSGIEPSLNFKARLEVVDTTAGCAVLKDKYQIYLGSFVAQGGISPTFESEADLIHNLKNQVVDLKLIQNIEYQTKNGYLPLFPLVHSETLSFSFKAGKISGTVPLAFDLNWVYKVPKPQNLSDLQKLSLAEKTTQFIYQSQGGYFAAQPDFLNLFLNLEPLQANLKKAYALLIWKTFKEYQNSTPYFKPILQFHVGGEGSFYGAPLATKLNVISHMPGSFSDAEVVLLLTDFPTWILVGYSGTECLNFTAANLEAFLETIHTKLPTLTLQEKSLLKDPMTHIAGPVRYVSACTKDKVSEKSKLIAAEILAALY